MSNVDGTQWSEYVEIPERKRAPVKLEDIIAQRIEAFLRAKKIKATAHKNKK